MLSRLSHRAVMSMCGCLCAPWASEQDGTVIEGTRVSSRSCAAGAVIVPSVSLCAS